MPRVANKIEGSVPAQAGTQSVPNVWAPAFAGAERTSLSGI